MFDGSDYPKSLDEQQFDNWLEMGRESKIPYCYLLIVWDALEEQYLPVFVEDKESIESFEIYPYSTIQEALIAVYDLYSESKISLAN
ncbi:hypothetical protein SAMN04488029_0118 [Reichenbachiella faecimaris]|uniref:Uncharacterized protein n=1 Tax=Reichenbachiella faecimaris TaxID=692418 RepID=A0A1W2G5B3_REIFA|nr:hypothetical protein [Reichenbachiella faecimaris]SMD31781.1 hypothetical protein SAMN04488029_0118 [Reichenbachiella faecimaris]